MKFHFHLSMESIVWKERTEMKKKNTVISHSSLWFPSFWISLDEKHLLILDSGAIEFVERWHPLSSIEVAKLTLIFLQEKSSSTLSQETENKHNTWKLRPEKQAHMESKGKKHANQAHMISALKPWVPLKSGPSILSNNENGEMSVELIALSDNSDTKHFHWRATT